MEGTRLQQLQEAQKVQDNRLNDLARNQDVMGQKMDGMDTKIEGLQVNVLSIMKNLEDITMAMVGVQKEKGPLGEEHNSHNAYERRENSRRKDETRGGMTEPQGGFNRNSSLFSFLPTSSSMR